MKTILITGGAGYLGLNISLSLLELDYNIVIVDTLENSYKTHINKLLKEFGSRVTFYKANSCNYNHMKEIFKTHNISQVLHLAGYKYIDESISHPKKYLANNMNSLKTILKLSKEYNVKRIAFASSAVVYGNSKNTPTEETEILSPLNPYANTKVDGEFLINEWHKSTNIPATIFRFSNPAGANTKYMFGDHSKAGKINLIPYIIKSTLSGQSLTFKGNNHPTKDGTSVRDYIHVTDLSNIVALVLNNSKDTNIETLNISTGVGCSLQEIINTTEVVLNKKLNYTFTDRNASEASVVILSNKKLCSNYNVTFLYSIKDIVSSQFDFFYHINTKS